MKTIVSVFGNKIDTHDNTAVLCLPELKLRLPRVKFLVQDPTESLEPISNPWIILDTAIGVDQVTMIETLDDLEYIKGLSVHDFDIYMELRLRAKLAPLPNLKIILVPQGDDPGQAVKYIVEFLKPLIDK